MYGQRNTGVMNFSWHGFLTHCIQINQAATLSTHVCIFYSLFVSSIEQDKGLDALHQVIQRQKMMGKAIGDEIDQQNSMCKFASRQ